MISQSELDTHYWRWRSALMLLVVLPFLPELVIFATSLFAEISGCRPDSTSACEIGSSSAATIIRDALKAASEVGFSFSQGVAAVWLAVGCIFITWGWRRVASRLLLALALSLVCAFVPYFGPMLSIGHLINPNCYPNEGGVGPCMIYGGNVGTVAHDAVRLAWRMADGAPIALGIFIVYTVVTIVMHLREKRRDEQPAR